MKIFQCSNCQNPVYFENHSCENCGSNLGYQEESAIMLALDINGYQWQNGQATSNQFKFCSNADKTVCNWLIPINSSNKFCTACSLNRTIPNLHDVSNHEKWRKLEIAKHRLIYQLMQIGLPLVSKHYAKKEGLCFDFISNKGVLFGKKKMTGHANGVITILLIEADSINREQIRKQLSEPYRTLIGHFRHEVGHYYWDQLIKKDQNELMAFRRIFGDESYSYSLALKTYYKDGPKKNWQSHFISKYASSHPWEDWAETWAHYLHIMDTIETAHYFGLTTNPYLSNTISMSLQHIENPYNEPDFDKIVASSFPLFYAVNSLNRSMGLPDVYPFVIPESVIEKMNFIHNLVRNRWK